MNLDLKILTAVNVYILVCAAYFGIFVYPYRELSEETKRRPRSFISNAFFREFWYFIMEPLRRRLISWGIRPNTITVTGLFFSSLAGVCFAFGKFGLGGWFVILAATCDVYDGMLARAMKLQQKSGAFFDSVLDRVGETFMFFGFAWYFREVPFWFVVVSFAAAASQMVSYCRARAEGLGFDKGASRGFFQRAERMIVLSILLPLSPLVNLLVEPQDVTVYAALMIIFLGSLQTAISRGVGIFREIRAVER